MSCSTLAIRAIALEGLQTLLHERRLGQEVVEGMRPAQALEAAREPRRMADQHDRRHVEGAGEPARGERGDGILHERPCAAQAGPCELKAIAEEALDVAGSPGARQLGDWTVPEGQRGAEVRSEAVLVVTVDVLEPERKPAAADAGLMMGIERLIDVADLRREVDHPADPGRAGAVRSGHQQRPRAPTVALGQRPADPLVRTAGLTARQAITGRHRPLARGRGDRLNSAP
jgi:hypothetical protein